MSPTESQRTSDDGQKNEREFSYRQTQKNNLIFLSNRKFAIAGSESGFDSINDGMLNGNNFMHIPLNIPLPPSRQPPNVPITLGDFSPQHSPVPLRKFHKQPIPDINFIESTPSPTLKGNHVENHCLIEKIESDETCRESEIKIDELNVEASKSNVRKEGIIADKIEQHEHLDIKVFPKDRAWVPFVFPFFYDNAFNFYFFGSAEKMIASAIVSNDFLCNILDNDSIKTVVDAMTLESFDVNTNIIEEGDSGNFLYVSAEGLFEVIKAGSSIKSFGPGVV